MDNATTWGGFNKPNYANLQCWESVATDHGSSLRGSTAPLTDRDRWTLDVTAYGNRWMSRQRSDVIVRSTTNFKWSNFKWRVNQRCWSKSLHNTPHMSAGEYLRYYNIKRLISLFGMNHPFSFWGRGVYYLLPTRPSLPESRTQALTKTPSLGRNVTRGRNALVYCSFIIILSPQTQNWVGESNL